MTVMGKKTLGHISAACARSDGLLTVQETFKEGRGRESGFACRGGDTVVGLTLGHLKTMM